MWQTQAYRALNTRLEQVLGDKTAKEFLALRVATVGDLIRHVPRRYLRGPEDSELARLQVGEDAAVLATVRSAQVRGNQRSLRLEVVVTDQTADLRLTFFGRKPLIDYWARLLTPGARGLFAGKVGTFQNKPQLTHPDFVLMDDKGSIIGGAKRNQNLGRLASAGGFVGIYPATSKLRTWQIVDCLELALDQLGELPEPLPGWVLGEVDLGPLVEAELERGADPRLDWERLAEEKLPELKPAIAAVHRPETLEEAWLGRQRLLFDEAFAVQAAMAYRRAAARREPAVARVRRPEGLLATFDERLPFALTDGQRRVSNEIFTGLEQTHPMQRLLQGEVGSGKTLVALRAMLAVVDTGGQAVLLAPTEVLAQQHHQTILDQLGDLAAPGLLAGEYATTVTLLSGSMTASQKRAALLKIASGEAGIVIGTHALLGDRVQFADLGLVVVDEQHRFGVEQRAQLNEKAATRPHVLVMTATPIPRTVAMTIFGDLEVSTLTEIPAGRSEVTTTVIAERVNARWVDRAWQRIREEVAAGRQAFVVCPQISGGSAAGDEEAPRNVTDVYAELSEGPLSGLRVEMLHGQLPAETKDEAMRRFAAGEVDVLVATTVIEVGVNVPNASVMVICDADRFGISQLHQLRGRIGRGAHPGLCLLLTRAEAETPAAERLRALSATRDGFALADADLAHRREGDVLGAAQAGSRSSLRLLRVVEHAGLIEQARALAERCADLDPELTEPGVVDAVRQTAELADAEWLERN